MGSVGVSPTGLSRGDRYELRRPLLRPALHDFLGVGVPMPGRALRSSSEALLISSGAFFVEGLALSDFAAGSSDRA
jgi:hypothetical protein